MFRLIHMARKQLCFLYCLSFRNMARKQLMFPGLSTFVKHGEETINVSWFVNRCKAWLRN